MPSVAETSVPQPPLAGMAAVVTGAAGGIGRAIACELAAAGADVLVHTRANRAGGEQTVRQIESLGRQAALWLGDLAEQTIQDQLVEYAFAWKPVQIWINNAGVDVLTGPQRQWSFEKKLEHLWLVDVVATVRLTRAAGTRMKQLGRGAILNIGWDQATSGMAGDSGELFATVKGAVMAFTRSAAMSLAPQVRVNCLAPGWIRTAWGRQAPPAWQRRAEQECLLGRWGEPEDVARVARFLVSPEAQFVNAQVIAVNGGFRPHSAQGFAQP